MVDQERHQKMKWFDLLYLLCMAAAFLWLLNALAIGFQANWGKALNQDIPEFMEGAVNSNFFYDSGLREPFHVFCLKITLLFVAEHEQAARLTTVIQTFAAAFALWFFAKEVFGKLVALISLWLFVINPIVIYYGVSGMRASVYMALLLAFAGMLWRILVHNDNNAANVVFTGVFAGALFLTRRYGVVIVAGSILIGLCVLWRFERQRIGRYLKVSGWIFLIGCLLLLPDLLFRETPAFKDNVNFFRNLELYGSIGAFRESPPVSFFHYVFIDHTPAQVVAILSQNIMRFPHDYLGHFFRNLPLFWIFAWGATCLIFVSPRFAWTSLLAWLSLAPIAFVLHLDQVSAGSGVENRLVIQTYALFLPGMVAALLFFIQVVLRMILKDSSTEGAPSKKHVLLDTSFWHHF